MGIAFGFFSHRGSWTYPCLRRSSRWHFQSNPPGTRTGALHRLRAGSAFPDRNNRTTRVRRFFLGRNRSVGGKGSRTLFEAENEGARTSEESRSLSFRSE